MPIEKVFAHISCSNLESSIPWFTKLFGRAPDETPMEGLAEWHQNNQAGFQLFQDPKNAGHATMTLGVSDLDSEVANCQRTDSGHGKGLRWRAWLVVMQ